MHLIHLVLLLAAGILFFLYAVDPRRPQLALRFVRLVLLAAVALVFLSPFAYIACAAIKDRSVLMEYGFLPPFARWAETLTLDNFVQLFEPRPTLQGEVSFWQYLLNSVFLASAGTVVQVFFCSLGGYALAKYRFVGRRQLMLFMIGSMMLPGTLFLAPTYELMVHLDWIDSYAALLIPGAANAFGMFLFRQAMLGVPHSLVEAARVDGASEFRIYLRVAMPLVQPMTAAFALIVFMGHWNSLLGPQVFLQTGYKLTVPVLLTQYVAQYSEQFGIYLAGTLLSILPIAALFLALQREFISGLTSGALKA
jgi:ABC-type glycerol-3-phosphate transport system permease component